MKNTDGFLENTALDYDMDLYDVRRINDRVVTSTEFYEQLEDFISERAMTAE